LVVAVAAAFAHPRARFWLVAGVSIAALAGLWMVLAGPLAGRLVVMDEAWLAVLAEKDYLFPHEWPVYAWIINLAYPVVIGLAYRRRRREGLAVPGEGPFVAGLLTLVAIFLVSVPLTVMRVALAVQMQVTRVFWLLDFVTAAYLAWWLLDQAARTPRARMAIIAILTASSLARGVYLVSHDRQLLTMALPATPWVEAMDWLRGQPASWYVLADPGHGWKYGVSVRLAAEKDTLVESGKDTALAMYDRQIAMAVADRLAAVGDFDRLTTADVRARAARFGLDVMVIESDRRLDFPELYRNRQFVIYDLR
jgi:hypothetical protein